MSAHIVLLVLGAILLLIGILVIISGFHAEKAQSYLSKHTKAHSSVEQVKKYSLILGGVLTLMGIGLFVWGLAIHTGHVAQL